MRTPTPAALPTLTFLLAVAPWIAGRDPTTDIRFRLPADSPVALRIYDQAGRMVRTLLDETRMPAGEHGFRWNGLDAGGQPVRSGIYFYELQVNRRQYTRKMVLLK